MAPIFWGARNNGVLIGDRGMDGDAKHWSTREAADLLGVLPGRLSQGVWGRRIDAPERSTEGHYRWARADLQRACRAMFGKTLDEVLQERGKDLK